MFADVIVDITNDAVDKVFEYSFDEIDNVTVGSRVVVPFCSKNIDGIVLNVKETSVFEPLKIKPIIDVLDEIPPLTKENLELCKYIQEKYCVPTALSLRLFLPSEMRKGKVSEQFLRFFDLSEMGKDQILRELKSNAVSQREAVLFLSGNGKTPAPYLNTRFGSSALNSLLKKGFIKSTTEKIVRVPYKDLESDDKKITLTDKQNDAIYSINHTNKQVTLIHGITGSGKTEVYLNLIKQVIESEKTAIMLVPEIALTPQMFKQLRAKFGDTAAILHSGLSAGEKFDEWWRLRRGEAKIAVGARSAIFAPLENVGLIIIDEEHDTSYASESSPRYQTLEIAKFRAKYNGCKIVLGSATPSVETYLKAVTNEFNLVELPDRINKKPLPEVLIADMREEVRRGNNSCFSSYLKEELKKCLEENNQAIIFLNQRGYSKTVVCTECGYVPKCKDCDVSLTYHIEGNALKCHYCNARYKMITACPECGSRFIKYGGTGTQKVVMELQKMFPQARILRMDRDTTSTKEGHLKILDKFSKKEADILVGTQMIAKGHDFPSVTLAAILDADMSLHFSDYRCAERTFQLITQVAGRSGRAEEKGKVVLQTYNPTNFVLQYATNYEYKKFFENEVAIRKASKFPPFADILRVVVQSENDDIAVEALKTVYSEIKEIYNKKREEFIYFGCMKAPLKRIQNKFRYQVLMRIKNGNESIKREILQICVKHKIKNVYINFEENPNNLT